MEPKETFWGMVTHFFYDITHFDGKFFVTLKDLLFRPGFFIGGIYEGETSKLSQPD